MSLFFFYFRLQEGKFKTINVPAQEFSCSGCFRSLSGLQKKTAVEANSIKLSHGGIRPESAAFYYIVSAMLSPWRAFASFLTPWATELALTPTRGQWYIFLEYTSSCARSVISSIPLYFFAETKINVRDVKVTFFGFF